MVTRRPNTFCVVDILTCVGTRCDSELVREVGPREKNSSSAAVDFLGLTPTKKAKKGLCFPLSQHNKTKIMSHIYFLLIYKALIKREQYELIKAFVQYIYLHFARAKLLN